MIEINETNHKVGWITGKVNFPRNSATFIVKGTYDLSPGNPAVPSAEQFELVSDVFVNEDPTGALYYSSDFAYIKPRIDLLLVGHCYAPHGHAISSAEVSFGVGSFSKSLVVIGNRVSFPKMFGSTITNPEIFTKINISFENSFGGGAYDKNPIGKGYAEVQLSSGTKGHLLPNIESPADKNHKVQPILAGFGPVPSSWPQCMCKTGTYDEKWFKWRWPWFPENFDWSFYNSALSDQQLSKQLKGNEKLRFVNLHPNHQIYDSALPETRVRCFYVPVIGAPIGFVEVPMILDTLWVDMDAEKLVLVWRGVVDIRSESLGENDQLLVISEPLATPPRSIAYYERLCMEKSKRLKEEIHNPRKEEPKATSATELHTTDDDVTNTDNSNLNVDSFDRMAMDVLNQEPESESVCREWCLAHFTGGGNFDGLDLSGVDLSDSLLEGASFQGAILVDACFRRANLSSVNFTDAILNGTDFTDADLHMAVLTNSDVVSSRLVRANLNQAIIDYADFTHALFRYANLESCQGFKVILSHANLFGANLKHSVLPEADLSGSVLHMSDFTDASLVQASIEGAVGFPIQAERANLTQLRASNAILWQSNFRNVIAPQSIWQEAQLKDADFSGADLTGAEFEGASLPAANFTCAVLRKARMVNANLYQAQMLNCDLFNSSLEKSDLTSANLSWSNLYGVEILDTKMDKINLNSANIKQTILTLKL